MPKVREALKLPYRQEPRLKYAVVYEHGPRSWGEYVPDLPGCVAVADTRAEVKGLIREAIAMHIEGLREARQPIPRPGTATEVVEI